MPTAALPRAQSALVDATGSPTREWYSYFLALRNSDGLTPAQQQQLDELAARVTALEDGGAGGGSIQGIGSIVTQGSPPGIVQISLEGDTDTPGNTWYYGTAPDGSRGWWALSDGLAVTSDLSKAVGSNGVTTFGLADLPNSGAGAALVKITRDAKGRISGTSAATTNDLTEGSSNLYYTDVRADARANAAVAAHVAQADPHPQYTTAAEAAAAAPVQSVNGKTGTVSLVTDDIAESGTPTNQWFTAARVRAVVLTGLSTATNAAIAATDSILVALGKLQAQVTARALDTDVVKLAGTQTITGAKTFSAGNVIVTGSSTNSTYFALRNTATGGRGYSFYSSGGGPSAAGTYGIYDETAGASRFLIGLSGQVQPGQNNVQNLGDPALLWAQVYAGNTTISSSDERLKTDLREMSGAEVAAFSAIARLPNVWRWIGRVESEGSAARLHAGPTVQAAMAIMAAHGLAWRDYAAFCYDEWPAAPAMTDLDGNEVQPPREAGDRYSFRREELLALIVRALAAQLDSLDARVAALESGESDPTPG